MNVHISCHVSLHMIGVDHRDDKNPMYGVHRFDVDSPMFGKHHTKEAKKKISEARLGEHHTKETRKKIKLASIGRRQSEEHVSRQILSRKIGRENYARIENDLIWDGNVLIDANEVMEKILFS